MFARTLSALAVSALLMATPALAQMESVSVQVKTGDLDLASEAGQAQLQRRVRHASFAICGQAPRDFALKESYDNCRSEVLDDAALKIAALKAKGGERIQVARRTR
jgi:UrcA family protein